MMVICDDKFDTKYDQIFQNSSQELFMFSKYGGIIDAPIIMLNTTKD